LAPWPFGHSPFDDPALAEGPGAGEWLAGADPDPVRLHFATVAAEAQLELERVHVVHKWLLKTAIGGDPTLLESEKSAKDLAEVLQDLNRLERYERRAFSRRNRALRLL
jgi:hypothetical protein